ncbi:hypothetical protein EDB19DRAFT_1830167 [Suillus lakei]|nr:hypothetical protein EDB19DRAFT_1830167 [Suillus lakei]
MTNEDIINIPDVLLPHIPISPSPIENSTTTTTTMQNVTLASADPRMRYPQFADNARDDFRNKTEARRTTEQLRHEDDGDMDDEDDSRRKVLASSPRLPAPPCIHLTVPPNSPNCTPRTEPAPGSPVYDPIRARLLCLKEANNNIPSHTNLIEGWIELLKEDPAVDEDAEGTDDEDAGLSDSDTLLSDGSDFSSSTSVAGEEDVPVISPHASALQ